MKIDHDECVNERTFEKNESHSLMEASKNGSIGGRRKHVFVQWRSFLCRRSLYINGVIAVVWSVSPWMTRSTGSPTDSSAFAK